MVDRYAKPPPSNERKPHTPGSASVTGSRVVLALRTGTAPGLLQGTGAAYR
jgi:hypothetical protein